MKISEINIYPIKSLGGISLNEAKIEERGLEFDRRWLLVDENNQFLTQREFPKLATLKTRIENEKLFISNGTSNEIEISPNPESDIWKRVKIWRSKVKAQVYKDQINCWFSDVLGIKCKLVFMAETSDRKVNPIYAVNKYKDSVSFADGYPYMLIGENSLTDLNKKLKKTLAMNRFRPNFVVKDSAAFEEDNWKKIKIGETVFYIVKPCDRCIITTINQENGKKSGKEPLKTLAEYRTKNGKVLFGQYMIAENPGNSINAGDKIEVLKTKN